jgi:hypothetical protein
VARKAAAARALIAADAAMSPAACRQPLLSSLRSAFDAVRGGSSRSWRKHVFARGPRFKVETCPMNMRRGIRAIADNWLGRHTVHTFSGHRPVLIKRRYPSRKRWR